VASSVVYAGGFRCEAVERGVFGLEGVSAEERREGGLRFLLALGGK
jgi:hypothetical protein